MANDGRAVRLDAEPGVVPVEGRIGAAVCGVPPEEPRVVRMDARSDDRLGSALAPRPFGRGVGEGWVGMPAFATGASGVLTAAERGGCFVPDAEGIAQ